MFHITSELDFKTDFGYNLSSNKNNYFSSQNLPHLSQDEGGVANINAYDNYYWQTENYLTWNKKINDRQKLTALLGVSLQQTGYERVRAETQNFIDDVFQYHYLQAGSVKSASESYDTKSALASFYARLNYSIDDKYLFTATGLYDGSSRFGKNNNMLSFHQ